METSTNSQAAEQIRQYRQYYEQGNTHTRFMNDLGHMFVSEDCGGDLNFVIYGPDEGQMGFASLNPPEVRRLLAVLQERVAQYEAVRR